MARRLSLEGPKPVAPRAAAARQAPAGKVGVRGAARDELSTGKAVALRSKAAQVLGGARPVGEQLRPRTAQDAIAEATRFFFTADRVGEHDQVGGTIERNPRDVTLDRAPANADAQRQLVKNEALEKEALAKLSPSQRAEYRRVASTLKDDPQARLALQLMLLDGRLASPQAASNGDTLLAGLDKLARQPLASGVDAATLLGQVVRELAVPSAISQGITQTCVAASAQIQLAIENPAEYLRLVAGLASPAGEVTLANGDTLAREPGWDTEESIRSLPSRLLQSSLMEYANGKAYDYDPASDLSVGSSLQTLGQKGSGLEPSELVRLQRGLFNREAKLVPEIPSGQPLTDAQVTRILEDAPALVGLRFAPGVDANVAGHAVLVTGVRDGRVYFLNPYGLEVSMPLEQFKQQVQYGLVDGA